jgi:hypothetical protein
MRKLLVAGVMSAIALIGTAMPAVAQPPGQEKNPEMFVCDGEDTLIVTAGRNGWIDGTQYHAVTFSIEGSFTPTGGTPEPFSEFKTWAGGMDANSPDLITCTADVSETDETGTFAAHFEVTAVPLG